MIDDMKDNEFVAFPDPKNIEENFEVFDQYRVNVAHEKNVVFEDPEILHKDRGFTFTISVRRSKVGFGHDIETIAMGMVRPVYIRTNKESFYKSEGIMSGCSIEVEEGGKKIFEYLTPCGLEYATKLLTSYMNSNYNLDYKVVDFSFFGFINGKYGPFKEVPHTDCFGTKLGELLDDLKSVPRICDTPRISEKEAIQFEFEQGVVWRNKEKLRVIEDGEGVFEIHSTGLPDKHIRLCFNNRSVFAIIRALRSIFKGYKGEYHRGIHTEMRMFQYGQLVYRDKPGASDILKAFDGPGEDLWMDLYSGYRKGTCFSFSTEKFGDQDEEDIVDLGDSAENPIEISDSDDEDGEKGEDA
jgi:hypothetical protein